MAQTQSEIRYLTPLSVDVKKKKYCRFKRSGIKYIDYKDPEFLKKFLAARSKEENAAQKVEEDYEKTRAQIQWQLIKEKVARNYDIKVEEEDMLRLARFYAAQQFAQYGMSNLPEDVIEKYAQELLKKDDVKSDIQNRAFEDKVYAAIQDAVGIDEKTVSVEDFNKLFEAAK